jgi:transposase, IS30 family
VNIQTLRTAILEHSMPRYTHLNQDERYQIQTMLKANASVNEIAKELGRHRTTIKREITRNKGACGYRGGQAHKLSDARSVNSRNALSIAESLWDKVHERLMLQQSPEQIAGCLPISHETIYLHIYADPTGVLKRQLRCQKKRRKRYASGNNRRGQIPNRRGIETRSPRVETRKQVGHWEADTVIGCGHKQALVTLVERKSRYTCIRKVSGKTAQEVSSAIVEMLRPLNAVVRTITCDNGKEFAKHETVDDQLHCQTFFARPYASWQRGTNENTNGLIRQYVPKNRGLNTVTNEEVQMIQDRLNHRPRKVLGFKTPHQILHASLKHRALRT